MPAPLSPEVVTEHTPARLPPYLSNGVLGIRFAGLPHLAGTTMVSGFAGLDPKDGVEGFARAPYVMATDVELDGVWASAAPEWCELVDQRYDFATGELRTHWTFRVDGATATVEAVAFCSRTVPSLAAVESGSASIGPPISRSPRGSIRPACRASVTTMPSPRTRAPTRMSMGGCGGTRVETSRRSASPTPPRSPATRSAERTTATRMIAAGSRRPTASRARTGRTYRLSLLTAVVPDLSHARPDEQAGRLAAVGPSERLRRPAARQPAGLG